MDTSENVITGLNMPKFMDNSLKTQSQGNKINCSW